MRICLYVGKAAPPEKQEEWLANAKSTCDVYARNLYREFTARGHEVAFASSQAGKPKTMTDEAAAKRLERYRTMNYPEADHAICLEQNGWRGRELEFFERARAATKGLVCAICDHDHAVDGPQDLIFTARRPRHGPQDARYVGWAADPEMFKPEKDPEWLTIFIDHKYDPTERFDDTEALLKSATTYAAELERSGQKVGNPPRRVQVVFFSPDGIQRIEPGEIRDVQLGTDRRAFYRRVDGPELAAWTRKTDIFVVTHGESMGLPVLENAMAGALIVAHRGFVKPELLRSLAHVEYDEVDDINWDRLASSLDPEMYSRRASHFSWGRVAERMLDAFEGVGVDEGRPEPEREGRWLISRGRDIAEFSSFDGWHAENIDIVDENGAQRLLAPPADSPRFMWRTVPKKPWPEVYTFSMQVRPNGHNALTLWLCGETDEERASVRFDLCTMTASAGLVSSNWILLDYRLTRVGEDVICHAAIRSDWAPSLRCQLVMNRGAVFTNDPKERRYGLQISRISLSHGLTTADWIAPISLMKRTKRWLLRKLSRR
jgi:hypothetical protein